MTENWPTKYWHAVDAERIQCDLCPRHCTMREGQRGLCYVRGVHDGQVVLHSYGRSSGFCIDPIEKKPLKHFYPGSSVLSLGTAGCNLACKFCQNWDISKSREMDTLASVASPLQLAEACVAHRCKSLAFTYNDPTIFHEYAIDCAAAAKAMNIETVAVTAGYVCKEPREEFFGFMSATNVDLKAFTQDFYKHLCGGELERVKETIRYIYHETDCWLELTTLIIPGENDSEEELQALCGWIREELGRDVPIHFSAFHPDHKMMSTPHTPADTLLMAQRIARENELDFAYIGNIRTPDGANTHCPKCQKVVIGRANYAVTNWALNNGKCTKCQTPLPGVFDDMPGMWGNKRRQVQVGQ